MKQARASRKCSGSEAGLARNNSDGATVAADEIGNTHLDVYKEPYSSPCLCICKSYMRMPNWLTNIEPITSHQDIESPARPKVIIPNFICHSCTNCECKQVLLESLVHNCSSTVHRWKPAECFHFLKWRPAITLHDRSWSQSLHSRHLGHQ